MYRKNFTELNSTELSRLANALNTLWRNGTISDNATLHNNNFYNGIHWGPAFLPWHRDFLLKFEQALQAIEPTVTLPYWDWTRSDSRDLDSGLWKTFFGGRNNKDGQFDHWTYTRRLTDPPLSESDPLPQLTDIITELQATTFTEYRTMEGRNEGRLGSHVPGHTWTGGTIDTMAGGNSPLDPLFYLHHCNLDRLWAIWQQNNPEAEQYNHTDEIDSDSVAAARVPLNGQMIGGSTPASMLNHRNLGYRYERDVLLEIAWYEGDHGNLQTGDPRSTDVYIRDASRDTGKTPSPKIHWASPDIWVRNEDLTAPNEDPDDGHQIPIANTQNYLYVRIHNRGTEDSGQQEVTTYHCNPGTTMLWPDHFTTIDTISVDNVPSGQSVRVGPFEWIPAIVDHECLLAITSGVNDPSVVPQFIGNVPHWKLVRFANNVGQRNVAPIRIPVGMGARSAMRVSGSVQKTNNRLRLDATKFPKDTAIQVRVPNSVADNAQMTRLASLSRNSRFSTLSLRGGTAGVIDTLTLRARQDINMILTFDFSILSVPSQQYPFIATQWQDGQLAGQLTLDVIAVKDPEDFVYGNIRSKELHTVKCPFWPHLSDRNKRPFSSIKEGLARGYNGCAFCLADYHTN